jgi:cytochrome c peroxidase
LEPNGRAGQSSNQRIRQEHRDRVALVEALAAPIGFKVPTLRNVAMTPPYFHDGSVGTLPEAVTIMAKVQLGKTLSDQDVSDIVAFLGSLTGKLPDNFADTPVLPAGAF